MTHIRPLQKNDRPHWQKLWQGYLDFYQQNLPSEITEYVFASLLDETQEMSAIVAEVDGKCVGLAHYFFHPTTWHIGPYAHLEDLYVSEDFRNQGIGYALIEELKKIAKAHNAKKLSWHTHKDNRRAQALYNKMSDQNDHIRYDIHLLEKSELK